MEGIRIVTGGKLLKTRWVYDEDKNEGDYVTDDVTDRATRYLFDTCTLEEGVTLRDIFQLLKRHLDVYKAVMGNLVENVVNEGLQPYIGEQTQPQLAYLELYWSLDYDDKEKELSGNTLPGFHGIGVSDEIAYSLMFTPANEIAELPLKLSQEFIIGSFNNKEATVYKGPDFSLGQILYGIVWELSWFGSPEERERKKQEITQR